jgi:hypothetical protein
LTAERLHLQVGGISGHGQDAQGIGVAKATLPALHSDDRRARFDNAELEGLAQTKPDTVVDLHPFTNGVSEL